MDVNFEEGCRIGECSKELTILFGHNSVGESERSRIFMKAEAKAAVFCSVVGSHLVNEVMQQAATR